MRPADTARLVALAAIWGASFLFTRIIAPALGPVLTAEARTLIAGEASLGRVPLDIRGTVFQRRVWDELRRIPRGETRSYQDIARAVGAPAAVRAVGSACGANPVALVVPCHRAVRTDGGLGGYAWGISRKQRLLELEKRRK